MNNNIIKINFTQTYLSDKAEAWLKSFIEEADLFETANNWEEFWRVYKEEPLLTLLATGLARKDLPNEISILREYPVYSSGIYIGACDLFLNYYKENKHFFIEAKYDRSSWETGFIDWSDENRIRFIKTVERQLKSYVEAEKDKTADSFTVVLLFYLLDFNNEDEFQKYRKRVYNNYNPPSDQFYALIPAKNPKESPYKKFGFLEVVGHIKEIQK